MKRASVCGLVVGGWMVLTVVSDGMAMGRIPKKEYQTKVDALEKCANRADSLERDLEETKKRVEELETKNTALLKDMESSKSDLQKKLAELIKEKEQIEKEKEVEVQKLKSTQDQLVSDMKKEIEQGTIQITRLKDKLSVNLVDKILFNSGEAEVNEQGKKVLKKVAEILKKVKDKQIRIEGHTDNIPIGGALRERFPSNWELSVARATNVTRYLEEAGGLDAKALFAAGFGEHRPIADNATPEGRSKNRRIEIVLVPSELAPPPVPVLEKR